MRSHRRALLLLLFAILSGTAAAYKKKKDETAPPPPPPKANRAARLTAGLVAGALSSVVLQPLDVVKTRMQSARTGRINLYQAAIEIWRAEGAGGLWAGTVPSAVRLAGGIALYFLFLGEAEAASKRLLGHLSGAMAAVRDFLLGAVSRGAAATLFCPITVLKTREEEGIHGSGNLIAQILTLGRVEGVAGLFAGLGPSLLRDVPYSGFSLLLLRFFREQLLRLGGVVPVSVVGALAGAASAVCATVVTQPADVVRTEIVLRGLKEKRLGSLRVVIELLQSRGLPALFVGTTARLARRVLQNAFTWAVYEVVVLQGQRSL